MSDPGATVVASRELEVAAKTLIDRCRPLALTIATAESCTGGLIAATLTEIAGSSDVFDRAYVTYSNHAKTEMLDIDAALIANHGAVSEPVARAMAEGALRMSGVGLAVAVTGVAGPGGGTAEKPVGRVHVAAASRAGSVLHRRLDLGDIGRSAVRRASIAEALSLVAALLPDDS